MSDEADDFARGSRDIRARPVDRRDTRSHQHIIVLRWDDAAADDNDISGTLLA